MARRFNGSNDRGAAALGASMPLSMACWFLSPADDGAIGTLMHCGATADTSGYILRLRSDLASKALEASIRDAATNGRPTYSATAVPRGRWAHAAGVFTSAADLAVFLDGLPGGPPVGTASAPTAPNSTQVGYNGRGGGALHFFSGPIAHAAVWSAALSAREVAALASGTSPLLVRPDALVEYWPLEGFNRGEETGAVSGRALTVSGTSWADGPPGTTTSTPGLHLVPALERPDPWHGGPVVGATAAPPPRRPVRWYPGLSSSRRRRP